MPITNFDELYTALNESFSGQINDLRSEIESIRNDLKSEIESVRNDLKADIAKLGAQMAAMEWRLLDRIRIEYDVDSVKQKRLDTLEKRVTAIEQKIA